MISLTMTEKNTKLVYSTDKAVPRKGNRDVKEFPVALQPSQQKVTVRLDRKGRGGKSVTVIEGLLIPETQREALLKQLKSGLGTGGAVRDSALEIQGDHRDALIATLEKMGYRPKRSGG
jgi:translation initiation factor 1